MRRELKCCCLQGKIMAGQQHPFPSGFPNTQQNAMRNQFGTNQMVSGLMGPQQGEKTTKTIVNNQNITF